MEKIFFNIICTSFSVSENLFLGQTVVFFTCDRTSSSSVPLAFLSSKVVALENKEKKVRKIQKKHQEA